MCVCVLLPFFLNIYCGTGFESHPDDVRHDGIQHNFFVRDPGAPRRAGALLQLRVSQSRNSPALCGLRSVLHNRTAADIPYHPLIRRRCVRHHHDGKCGLCGTQNGTSCMGIMGVVKALRNRLDFFRSSVFSLTVEMCAGKCCR